MKQVELKEVKKGDFVRLSDKPNAKTYIREEYDRETKRYCVVDCNDIWGTGRQLQGTTKVFIDFEY